MQVTTAKRSVVSANLGEQGAFKIAQNSHAFKILSDSLYSDKILAICRELGANAIDSHKVAGQTRPYEVKLPNQLDPTFYVKDFGTGLSHDRVMNLFSTYFMSDKSGNNDSIGGFGLGSKSPFSYTDSFTVISNFAGKSTTYNAFISENGCPEIVVMHEEAISPEETGLEIAFSVRAEDFRLFADRLDKATAYFPVKPVVVGNPNYRSEPINYEHEGKGWAVRKSGYGNYHSNLIMGGVAYPIDEQHFKQYEEFLEEALDIFMDIGSVDINPSREALNYRKESIKIIKDRLDEIINEIQEDVKEAILKQTNLWDAVCVPQEWSQKSTLLRLALTKFPFEVDFKGTKITPNMKFDKKEFLPGMHVRFFEKNRVRATSSNSKTIMEHVLTGNKVKSPAGLDIDERITKFYINGNTMTPDPKTIIVFDDLKTGGGIRFSYWREQKERQTRNFIEYVHISDETLRSRTHGKNPVKYPFPALTEKAISDFFNGAKVYKTSDMSLPPQVELDLAQKALTAKVKGERVLCFNATTRFFEKSGSLFGTDLDKRAETITTSEIIKAIKEYKKLGNHVLYVRQNDPRYPYNTDLTTWVSGYSRLNQVIDVLIATKLLKNTTIISVKPDSVQEKLVAANGATEINLWITGTLKPLIAKIDLSGTSDLALFVKAAWFKSVASKDGNISSLLKAFTNAKRRNPHLELPILNILPKIFLEAATASTLLDGKYGRETLDEIETVINYDYLFDKVHQATNNLTDSWTKELTVASNNFRRELVKYPLINLDFEENRWTGYGRYGSNAKDYSNILVGYQEYIELKDKQALTKP